MLEGILEGQMAPQYFPVQTLKNMGAGIDIAAIDEGRAFRGRGLHGAGAAPTRTDAQARWRSGSRMARARSSMPATPATAPAVRPPPRSSSTGAPTC